MFGDLFRSKGTKRTIASVLAVAACIASHVPQFAPFAELLVNAAGLFGAVGVAHAVAKP